MKKLLAVIQVLMIAAIILVFWLIKMELTSVAHASMVPATGIYVVTESGKFVPYQHQKIVRKNAETEQTVAHTAVDQSQSDVSLELKRKQQLRFRRNLKLKLAVWRKPLPEVKIDPEPTAEPVAEPTVEPKRKAKLSHTLIAKMNRHKKLPNYGADIQQRIREIEPELADVLIRLAACESTLNPEAVGDYGHSHGLYQIFLRWHPDVSLDQARDIDFATRWSAKKIRQGKGHIWTCWAKI